MAISRVSSASAAANTVAMPSHAIGDLIIAFAYRDGNTTAPALASGQGWTNLDNSGGNTNSARVAYKFADSTSEATGTFTNATGITIVVYRGAHAIGNWDVAGAASNSIGYPVTTLHSHRNDSWVLRFAGHRTATNLLTNTPGGYTAVNGVATESRAIDTNATVATNPTLQTQSVNQSSGWRAYSIEILASPLDLIENESDQFTGSIGAMWANWGGAQVTIDADRLKISIPNATSNYYGIDTETVNYHSINESSMLIQSVSISDTTPDELEVEFQWVRDEENRIFFLITAGQIFAYKEVAGAVSQVGSGVAYVPGTFIRLRVNSATAYWEYATLANAQIDSWTTLHSEATTLDLSQGYAVIDAGCWDTSHGPIDVIWDNFNYVPPAGGAHITKVKIAGTFEDVVPKVKVSGSFVEIEDKVKQSGSF